MDTVRRFPLPYAILALLLAAWIVLGLWICLAAPFGSGTDESIQYVAFSAAKDRWATREDFSRFGVEHYYYPPLYFLLFAPFFGDEPSFTKGFPVDRTNYLLGDGGALIASKEYLRTVPPELIRLYRAAKLVSLLFGLGIVLCLCLTIGLLVDGPPAPWVVLGGVAPVLLLPQFLYYHTLVNNDPLVNFWGALAVLCFVAAARREGRGDGAGGLRMAGACAGAVGLGLLTKQSALSLLPLPAALAALPLLSGRGVPWAQRAARAATRVALLGGVVVAAGGWWLVRTFLAGDPLGLGAQRIAHPWALRIPEFSWAHLWWTLGELPRNTIALFAGALYGIPDRIYLLYLALGAAVVAGLLPALARCRGRRASGSEPLRRFTAAVLAGTALFNLLLVLAYNLQFSAPYGRLLFPTLTAALALFALALHRVASSRPGVLAAAVLLLTGILSGLFAWTFTQRMTRAVLQPAENLVAIGFHPRHEHLRPVWEYRLDQRMRLPPGRLLGLRVGIVRANALPQAGAVLRAALQTVAPDGTVLAEYPFRAFPLGELEGPQMWAELTLQAPLELAQETRATLRLAADRSWFLGRNIEYLLIPLQYSPRLRPLLVNGAPLDRGLPVAAVYE